MFHQKRIVSFDFMVTKTNRLYQSTGFSDETFNAFCILYDDKEAVSENYCLEQKWHFHSAVAKLDCIAKWQ